jgi:hypothetical protein
MKLAVHIHVQSSGEFCQCVEEVATGAALPDLKEHVTAAIGQPVRRISRFMQLALIGAGRCVQGQSLPSNTGVFLASARGDLELTTDTINQVFRNGAAPKPLNFVNTVSNAAAFYVAQCLKLSGRSSFVCNRYFAFESALQLALCALQLGELEAALIGTVDGVVAPLHQQRRRLQLHSDTPLAESSHWLYLTRANASSAVSQLSVEHCNDWDQLLAQLETLPVNKAPLQICAGQTLSPSDDEKLLYLLEDKYPSLTLRRLDKKHPGYYATQSAGEMNAFIRSNENAALLHINSDRLGRYCVLQCEKEV